MNCRLSAVLLVALFDIVRAKPEYVTRKFCKEVDPTQCTIHSVIVDPCSPGPAFCNLKRNKVYGITLDMIPHFSASKLKLSVFGDVDNSGNFSTVVKSPDDACSLLYCPLLDNERRIFDVNLSLDKRASGKFPLKVKMWNEDKSSEACCVTFNVKVK